MQFTTTPMTEPTVPTTLGADNVLRETSTGLPICMRTGEPITDAEAHIRASHPDYPHILYGPYSKDAWPYVKVCTKCNTPHMVDDEDDIKYYGDGVWMCSTCASKSTICSECNKLASDITFINDKKYCKKCFNAKYFICSYSGELLEKKTYLARVVLDSITTESYKKVFEDYGQDLSVSAFSKLSKDYTPLDVSECRCCKDVRIVDEHGYCSNCYDRGSIFKCALCKKKRHIYSPVLSVCSCCWPKSATCFITNKTRYKKDMYKVKHPVQSSYCLKSYEATVKSEYYTCDVCLYPVDKRTTTVLNSGMTVCNDCRNAFDTCPECSEPHFGEYSCRGFGKECHVRDYSFKPVPIMHYTSKEGKSGSQLLVMGVENEQSYTSSENKKAALVNVANNYKATELYVKDDSSIRGYGFEVVTHPYTLEAFKKMNLDPLFSTSMRLKDNGCGMHVHINKGFFKSDIHLFKFVNFINNNPSFTKKVAGRGVVSYSERTDKVSRAVKDKNTARYSFVNLNPVNTVEVRIFKGCTDSYTFKYRIEFCDALARFTVNASIKDKVPAFKSFLKERRNKKRYPNLYRFLFKS